MQKLANTEPEVPLETWKCIDCGWRYRRRDVVWSKTAMERYGGYVCMDCTFKRKVGSVIDVSGSGDHRGGDCSANPF
jgi:hypothetical protein